MLLAELVATSEACAATRARTQKIALLADAIRQFAPDEVSVGVGYLAGQPRQERLEVGWAALSGAAAEPAAEPSLHILDVDAALEVIASDAGAGSRTRRLDALAALLGRATAEEQRWLRALISRDLRQGALAGIVVQAIARAASVPEAAVRRATMLCADLGAVAAAALARGEDGLGEFGLELFQPLEPMLAQTASDVGAAIEQLGRAAIEAKLDGARIQVHRDGGRVAIYTRNLRDVTARMPEVVALVRDMPAQRLVLDGEVVAHRPDGRPQPFQVTMSRFGRDHEDPVVERATMWPAFFDCLHVDGEDLLDRPLDERAAALERVVPTELRVDRLVVDSSDAARAFEAA
ncbi:MAG TPA: hypothetical protein VGV67_07005, partial [Solirubrobacteraceae bacterium]|nr:hypothetical protein [Solirubrobacteraceae bacterium]